MIGFSSLKGIISISYREIIGLGLMLNIVGMRIAYLLANLAKTEYFVCQDFQIKKTKKNGKNQQIRILERGKDFVNNDY